MTSIGLFAALLAVLSQIQIPMPSGVPVTMQTFAVALIGFTLGWKDGLLTMLIYLLLGGVGLLAAGCGASSGKSQVLLGAAGGGIGLILCHALGILQYSAVAEAGLAQSFLLVSAPYLIKDVLSAAAAFAVSKVLRRGIRAAGGELA